MSRPKKISIVLIFFILAQLIPAGLPKVLADQQFSPGQLAVEEAGGLPVIGYTLEKGHYVGLRWNQPSTWRGNLQYYELYYSEDGSPYSQYGGQIEWDHTGIEMEQLKPGTVYKAYIVAVHEHYIDGNLDSRDVSLPSNEVTFMTNLEVKVQPAGTGTLEIQWTDVSCSTSSVDYAVYISESSLFAHTPPIDVTSGDIGSQGPVTRTSEDTLLYYAKDLKPGTVYYIKIKTIIDDQSITYIKESETVCGYTNILASISKVSSSWWKLEWRPVTNTNLSQEDKVLYKIMRSVDGDLEREISATRDNYILVKMVGDNVYYRVQADLITEMGETVRVVSIEQHPLEGEIPSNPAVPELTEQLANQTMEAGPTSLKILWRVPTAINGEIDFDLSYDIWMLTDSDEIDNPAVSPTVQDFKPDSGNYVYEMIGSVEGDTVLGFSYTITGLEPDSVYYLKMTASKTYTVADKDGLVERKFSSEPALKIIVTPSEGSIDQPVIPSKPPLKVKTETVNGEDVQTVTSTTATLEWRNQWHEVWRSANSRWEYLPDQDVAQASVNGDVYRLVSYDSDVRFSVGYEVYTDTFDFSRLLETINQMPTQFNDIPNTPEAGPVEFTVTGLNPNSTYIMWVRAYRTNQIKSGLSDPVIVTTRPDHEIPLEQPAIPEINYSYAGDTFIELGWNIIDNHYYNIRYSTTEDVEQADDVIELTPDELEYKTKYTVEELSPDTTYYFWVSAEMSKDNETLTSDWSDVCIIKTKPYQPPDRPTGFGLKNISEPIGKDYIYFEWIAVAGLEYTLEISKEDDFSDAQSFGLESASEYKVEGLEANTRYYARIYAYDSVKNLKSGYSSISVRTNKSSDEYLSDVDDPLANSEEIKPERVNSGLGRLDATGVKADKLIQQIFDDRYSSYTINYAFLAYNDMDQSQTKLSPRVLEALNQTGKKLIINNGEASLLIEPDIIKNAQVMRSCRGNTGSVVEIVLDKITDTDDYSGSSFESDIWKISFKVNSGAASVSIDTLDGSLKIRIPYDEEDWYDETAMSGHIYDNYLEKWEKVNTENTFDSINSGGMVWSDIPGTSDYVIMNSTASRFSDISYHHARSDIESIVDKYDLKSLGYGLFQPNTTITKGEAVKVVLDILGYDYNERNYLDSASKAGITSGVNRDNVSSSVTKEEAASMIVRMHEIITGTKAESTISLSGYRDAYAITDNLVPRVRFAVAKGILVGSGGYLRPEGAVTRAEMMTMLRRMFEWVDG